MLNAVKLQPCHAPLVDTVDAFVICNVQRFGPAGNRNSEIGTMKSRSGTYLSSWQHGKTCPFCSQIQRPSVGVLRVVSSLSQS